MQSVYQQTLNFIITIGIGFLVGIIFDIYRVVRSIWQPKKLGTFIGDIFFWILITFLVFTLLLMGNWGEVRIYVFLGLTLGFTMYIKYFSLKGQKFISKFFYLVYKILRLVWKVITWPFKVLFAALLIPVGFILTAIIHIGRFLRKLGGLAKIRIIDKAKAIYKIIKGASNKKE